MRIGIDVGGTFTDVVTELSERGIVSIKTPSTPDDPARGVMAGLRLLAEEIGIGHDALLGDLRMLVHGTTVATNILVERRGARMGLVTTRGFRDLLELRDGTKQDRYNLRAPFPAPLIPRELRLEVRERCLADGTVETPLDIESVDAAIDRLLDAGVEAVAICLLHAHRFPRHEMQIARRLKERAPGLYIARSSEVLRRAGEYDRLSTTVADAYAGPALAGYLTRLGRDLAALGSAAPVAIMQSNGGVLPVAEAARFAVGAVTSGPAGGAMAAALYARHYGLDRVVSYDTGGTSSDVCVVLDGKPTEASSKILANTRIAVPAIEIDPVALGGGSIAAVDRAGLLTVGPHSVGADPGPAAFGKGGERATLTDANLLLGYLAPDAFLGGRIRLDGDLAAQAVGARVAEPLGIPLAEAAEAIYGLATQKIAEGLRRATIRRGLDPRGFTLLPFGGAGGLHADAVARDLGIRRAVIPEQASVLSAFGFLAAELRRDLFEPVALSLDRLTDADLTARFAALESRARTALAETGVDERAMDFRYDVVCRYRRQVSSLTVPLSQEELGQSGLTAALQDRFTQSYRQLYQHSHPEPAFVEELRIAAFGHMPEIALPAHSPCPGTAEPIGERRIRIAGAWHRGSVYDLDQLSPGARFSGPAIAVSRQTTVLVLPGTKAHLDAARSLILDIPEV